MLSLRSTLALLCFALPVGATTLNYDLGSTGNKDGSGNLVWPYKGNLGGPEISFLCDDFTHDVSPGNSFTVNISTISNLTGSRFGSVSAATSLYEEVAFLASYLPTASVADIGNIQDAIWSIFSTGTPTTNLAGATRTISQWRALAVSNYQGKDYSLFRIATDATNQAGGKQELVYFTGTVTAGLSVATPEPAAIVLFGSGLCLLIYRGRRRAPVTAVID